MTGFAAFVRAAHAAGRLVVQPRMGFGDPATMRAGLVATRRAAATSVGTITLDSYTRVGDYAAVLAAEAGGTPLNGYPIVTTDRATTADVLADAAAHGFPVQVRHGSPLPGDIVDTLVPLGLDATEGGPVSYCLPYSRTPLREAVVDWARTCELLASRSATSHLESFGGCLLGQLCPPSLLIAVSVLEGLFFRQHGMRSVSLSYAQQTDFDQDVAAIAALRRLASEFLSDVEWHGVLYTYMGVFPRSTEGALELLRHSAVLAVRTGTERLIVKTPVEAFRIPTIEDNVVALEEAARVAAATRPEPAGEDELDVYGEARALVEAVLELHPDVGQALITAFERGYLDIPYCLHGDNRQQARSYIDDRGRLRWLSAGRMPVKATPPTGARNLRAEDLLHMLSHVQTSFDALAITGRPASRREIEREPQPIATTPDRRRTDPEEPQ